MLSKIVAVQNVGRFIDSRSSGNPALKRCTLVLGANGFGKTTLCAVLRSLKSGDPAPIVGRKTLGSQRVPTVHLMLSTGDARFDGKTWSTKFPDIALFDGKFVTQNVYTGEAVDLENRRNLYHVIIGEHGVQLAEQEAKIASDLRTITSKITAATRTLSTHLSAGLTLQQFLELPEQQNVEALVVQYENKIRAVKEANRIQERAGLEEIQLPQLPEELPDVLSRSLDDIAGDSEALLSKHLLAHDMSERGREWIVEGLPHAKDDSCPFCGQTVRGLPLIHAYRMIFGDQYKSLKREIASLRTETENRFGAEAVGGLRVQISQNRAALEFWRQYCPAEPIEVSDTVLDMFGSLRTALLGLLDQKAKMPLERIEIDLGDPITESYRELRRRFEQINVAIRQLNGAIARKKSEVASTRLEVAEQELERLRVARNRHSSPVKDECSSYATLTAHKQVLEQQKKQIRAQLETYSNTVVSSYEMGINKYLKLFNAGFSIINTGHRYPGGSAASTYQLSINETAVDLGDDATPESEPSFRNTLSAGDRTTLALAFFLTSLDQDGALSNKVVVFDDPFSSQDAFRRRRTVHEIARIADKCSQVITLSHDATFLKQVWDKAPASQRVALGIIDHRDQGSKISSIDLDAACKGRTAIDIDDLVTYHDRGEGRHVDVVRKIRVVLEAYCWSTFPAHFCQGDTLGRILQKIREGGDGHPAWALYGDLDDLNEYTQGYHHGEGRDDAVGNHIDPKELTGYVRRTLELANALQA